MNEHDAIEARERAARAELGLLVFKEMLKDAGDHREARNAAVQFGYECLRGVPVVFDR